MSEAVAATAGSLLKAAREKQGIHVAALAASIKVTPRKLEALESDRYEELPDMTFVRALAKTVCRTLKIDADPVLALLPHRSDRGGALADVSTGLNQPFRERPSRSDPPEWAVLQKPVLWGAGLMLVAALVVYLVPEGLTPSWLGGPSVSEGADEVIPSSAAGASAAVGEAVEAASAAIETVHSVPSAAELPASAAEVPAPVAAAPAASVPAPAASGAGGGAAALVAGPLVLRATAESWIEVRDGGGRVLLSRTLQPGETVGLDGQMPLRATIGNAAGTQVSFRGQPVDVSATRDNVARLELQ
ncbi:helix-turn-helix domain-containing protein [Aquincola sp. MAHUQ-54]|uniref:Helix-turn-helix domain-containing protein n=1 Tax=Aquincola agrisoli TaxID=3119538 RepID=A0AAW9QN65_9BURK